MVIDTMEISDFNVHVLENESGAFHTTCSFSEETGWQPLEQNIFGWKRSLSSEPYVVRGVTEF